MVLGALIKNTVSLGLWPPSPPPFTGMSFCHLSEQILEMRVPSSCDRIGQIKRGYGGVDVKDCGGVKESIEASLRILENQLCGLDLSTFKA
jgi:hypothetical protein